MKASDRTRNHGWSHWFQYAKSNQTSWSLEISLPNGREALPSSAGTRHRFKPLSCPGPPQKRNLHQRGQKAAGGGYLHEPPMAVRMWSAHRKPGFSHGFYIVLWGTWINVHTNPGISVGLDLVPETGDCNWKYVQVTKRASMLIQPISSELLFQVSHAGQSHYHLTGLPHGVFSKWTTPIDCINKLHSIVAFFETDNSSIAVEAL